MIYKNVLVDVPNNVKIVKNGNQFYVYLILEKEYKKDKKYVVEKRKVIGNLIEKNSKKMHPNDIYYLYFPNENQTLLENKNKYSDVLSLGQFLAVEKIFQENYLNEIIKNNFPEHLNLIKSLTTYYIDSQSMVNQLFSKWAFKNYSGLSKIPSESTISNLFNKYITDESVDNFIFSWAKQSKLLTQKDNIFLSIDSTNFNINSKNIPLAEYGLPKVDEGLPQVNLTLALNQENYLPMFYDLYSGSITDQTHCKKVIEKCIDYNYKNMVFVLDRGYFSSKNLDFIDNSNYKFVIMAKSYNKKLQELLQNNADNLTKDVSNFIENKKMYAKKFNIEIFNNSNKKYFVYLFFNLSKRNREFESYMLTLNILRKQLKNTKILTDEILRTYQNYFDFNLKEDTKEIVYIEMNKEKFDNFYKHSGYFIIVSNEDYDCEKIIDIYKQRDAIEKTFKALKSNLDFSKNYYQNTISLKSKTLVAFISSIVRARIYEKCKTFIEDNLSETFNTIFSELSKIEAHKINGIFKLKYALTAKQKEILKLLNIDEKFISNSLILLNKNQF